MCHGREVVEQLQDDLEHFTLLAEAGDEDAVESAERTALELQALGVKPARPTRPLFDMNTLVDARTAEVAPPRARLGFVRI